MMRKEKLELQKQIREDGVPVRQVVEVAKDSGALHVEDHTVGA